MQISPFIKSKSLSYLEKRSTTEIITLVTTLIIVKREASP